METFRTSFCRPFNLVVETDGRGLLFNIPREKSFDKLIMRLTREDGQEVTSCEINRNGRNYVSTSGLPDGEFSLEVYKFMGEANCLRGYFQKNEVLVKISAGVPSFVESWCLRGNMAIAQQFSHSRETIQQLLSSEDAYPCHHPEIRNIALAITKMENDDYGKLLAVHDWVAENVFYDRDSLRQDGSRVVAIEKSVVYALRTRRAVCKGYSDLAVSLLRACGVPSVTLGCFALGQSNTGGWEREENRVETPNHAFTVALIHNRYVLMDVTWDSDNEYSEGRYKHKTGLGKSRKYFDTSQELFAATHRLLSPIS